MPTVKYEAVTARELQLDDHELRLGRRFASATIAKTPSLSMDDQAVEPIAKGTDTHPGASARPKKSPKPNPTRLAGPPFGKPPNLEIHIPFYSKNVPGKKILPPRRRATPKDESSQLQGDLFDNNSDSKSDYFRRRE